MGLSNIIDSRSFSTVGVIATLKTLLIFPIGGGKFLLNKPIPRLRHVFWFDNFRNTAFDAIRERDVFYFIIAYHVPLSMYCWNYYAKRLFLIPVLFR